MRKLFFILCMAICSISAHAHDIAVVNTSGKIIYYNYTGNNELEVTYRGNSWSQYLSEYTGVIVIPKTVTYNTKTYTVTNIGYAAFYGCSDLTAVTIPSTVTSVTTSSFRGCTSLGVLNITDGLKKIESNAFLGCSRLNYIIIPSSMTSIGTSAFSGCSGFTSIYSNIVSPFSIADNTFYDNTYTSATLYVPYGKKSVYQATDGWKNFKNIVEMEPSAVEVINGIVTPTPDFNICDINGNKLTTPHRGINLFEMSDGTTKKIVK